MQITLPLRNQHRDDGSYELCLGETEFSTLYSWTWVILAGEEFAHRLAVGLDDLLEQVRSHHPDVNTYEIAPGPTLTSPDLKVIFTTWPRRLH